jgi:hypothetical protein
MVGGTTANDLATCELKVMKQKGNSKNNPNPNRKGKTFLLREDGDGVRVVRWKAFPAIRIRPLREALDSAVVVIDGIAFSIDMQSAWNLRSQSRPIDLSRKAKY